MEDGAFNRLNDNCITAIETGCKKMAIMEDRLLLDMLERYHCYGE